MLHVLVRTQQLYSVSFFEEERKRGNKAYRIILENIHKRNRFFLVILNGRDERVVVTINIVFTFPYIHGCCVREKKTKRR